MGKGNSYKKGLWTVEEDRILTEYIRVHGKGRWNRTAKMTGLKRCGKSCRLRWINYLSPNIKHGDFSEDEDDLIIRLHNLLGNRWSLIAGRVPGRTDNQIKNHWNYHLSKKLGFRKGKTKIIASARTTLESFNLSVNINSKPHSHGNGEAENEKKKDIKDHGSGGLIFKEEEEEEKTMSEGYLSSFSFSSDDFNVNAPSLTQLLDQHSPEFVWHGL